MLIYTRRTTDSDDSTRLNSSDDELLLNPSVAPSMIAQATAPDTPEPPLHAAQEVDRLNAIFKQEIQRYEARCVIMHLLPFWPLIYGDRKREVLHEFKGRREEKMSIYRKWHIGHHSEVS